MPIRSVFVVLAAAGVVLGAASTLGGPLNPPAGPIASTPGPEPRTPISLTTTPGDGNSLFRITQPGSYYLTGNVTGVSGKAGIEITTDNVTIDLNGFTMTGVPGALQAINDQPTAPLTVLQGVSIHDGVLDNWPGGGIIGDFLGSRFERIHVRRNGNGHGIACGGLEVVWTGSATTIIADCTVTFGTAATGTFHGLLLGSPCQVSRCTIAQAPASGIHVAAGPASITSAVITNCDVGIDAISALAPVTVTGAQVSQCPIGIRTAVPANIESCTVASAAAIGIEASSGSTLRNCAVAGPGGGIVTGSASRLENCTVRSASGIGIVTDGNCVLTGCIVERSDTHGFYVGASCVLSNCTAATNGGDGFILGIAAALTDCISTNNFANGFSGGGSFTGCRAHVNSFDGYVAASAALFTACTATNNERHGFNLANDGVARACLADSNGSGAADGSGFLADGSDARVEACHAIDNDIGFNVTGAGNILVRNSASGNTVNNYVIVAGNRYGPVIDATAATGAAMNGNSAPSTALTTDPFANFAY